jgi:hypothetical protein
VGVIVEATFRIPPAGARAFAEYEQAVLPLVTEHGGRVHDRRTDGATAVHELEFPDEAAYAAFRADPRLTPRRSLLASAGITEELGLQA